ncbi:AraC family transcriptional regulator [Halarcobacter anaerophilus]|uniref:AraC family transcriptional regulator n=1 Tax=Halarcobacter anaerophilus TaxID=877500 RepID=A0A4Q0Y1D7_9BACT|nr:AraC family transcriptional regulator [Halarcobacter anaerophilus]QDF28300.1 transcriptional regulator, AraC family [Halarcobacter anaerophilus]RXJ62031.1 AraC family transcriptional regulator [Halarcobacter anaerophilus]
MKLESLNQIFFENIQNSNGQFSKHFHNTYTIGLTHDGIFKSINQNKATLTYKNATRVINPGEVHCGNSNSWKYTNFYPTVKLITDIYEQIFFERKTPVFVKHIIEDLTLYKLLFKFFVSAYENKDSIEIETYLIEALSYLIKKYADKTKSFEPLFNDKKIIKHTIEYINDSIETNLSLEELALNSNLSKYHYIRTFKNSTGITPHQYIMMQRVQKAKELILKNVNLNEIASSVGFSDQSHFIRTFKKIYGYVPSQIKENSNFVLYKKN